MSTPSGLAADRSNKPTENNDSRPLLIGATHVDPLAYFFIGFGIFVVFLMLVPGRWLWRKYVALAELRPGEAILYTEDRVRTTFLKTKWSMSTGGHSLGFRRTRVTITNERILEHWGTHMIPYGAETPVGIINFKAKVKPPGFLQVFDASYFLNVDTLAFQVDHSGHAYLEVSDEERGISIQFFFQNMDAVRAVLADAT